MSETLARGGMPLNRFNNLPPFAPGKTRQAPPNAAKRSRFAANCGILTAAPSQSGTLPDSRLSRIVTARETANA